MFLKFSWRIHGMQKDSLSPQVSEKSPKEFLNLWTKLLFPQSWQR